MKKITKTQSISKHFFRAFAFFAIVNSSVLAQNIDHKWEKGGLFDGFTRKQEEIGKRTKHSKHFLNSDGSHTAQIGSQMHYQESNGTWKDINLNIAISDGSFSNIKNEFNSNFPLQAGTSGIAIHHKQLDFHWWTSPKLQFSNNGQILKSFNPAAVKGTAKDDVLRYENIYPGITEEFILQTNGIENNTVIKSLSPEMSQLSSSSMLEFKQFIPFQSGWTIQDNSGKTIAADFQTPTFHITIPGSENGIYFGQVITFDKQLDKQKALALLGLPDEKLSDEEKKLRSKNIHIGQYQIARKRNGIEVTVALPANWLQEPNRVFPVTIDPMVSIEPAGTSDLWRTPLTHLFGYQRVAHLYLASELNFTGSITSIEFYKNVVDPERTKPCTVYMRSIAQTSLSALPWNSTSYTGNLTPLYDSNLAIDRETGWKTIPLTIPFDYSSGNLLIMVKDIYGGGGNRQDFRGRENSMLGRMAWSVEDNTDPGDGDLLETNYNDLPDVRIIYSESLSIIDTVQNTLQFYPNPINNFISLSQNMAIASVSAYNLLGQEIFLRKIGREVSQIDLSDLSKGIYLIKIMPENGSEITLKVVKE